MNGLNDSPQARLLHSIVNKLQHMILSHYHVLELTDSFLGNVLAQTAPVPVDEPQTTEYPSRRVRDTGVL